jgi:thymidylate kinase
MQGIMVAIEGLDIVGKTTIARSLSEKNDWVYYKTPPPAYYNACVQLGADGYPVYNEDRFWLFIECLKYSSREISKLLNSGVSVAVDRWLWTTLSYHFAFNPELEATWQKVACKEVSALIQPQLSILTHIADKEVYERRKASRKKLTAHDKMVVNDTEKSEAISHNFRRLNPNFVLVDNSGDLKSTMAVVWKHICAVNATN